MAARVLPAHSPAVAARLDALFDPEAAVRAKAARGGTAPDAVRASLEAALQSGVTRSRFPWALTPPNFSGGSLNTPVGGCPLKTVKSTPKAR